jgi:hypothetical protein
MNFPLEDILAEPFLLPRDALVSDVTGPWRPSFRFMTTSRLGQRRADRHYLPMAAVKVSSLRPRRRTSIPRRLIF